MLNDFKRALARLQSDYGFYVDCQVNPAVALAGYDLSAHERSVLIDPDKLADVFRGGIDVSPLRITFSGTHDWVNRTRPKKRQAEHERRRAGGRLDQAGEHEQGAHRRRGAADATDRLSETDHDRSSGLAVRHRDRRHGHRRRPPAYARGGRGDPPLQRTFVIESGYGSRIPGDSSRTSPSSDISTSPAGTACTHIAGWRLRLSRPRSPTRPCAWRRTATPGSTATRRR